MSLILRKSTRLFSEPRVYSAIREHCHVPTANRLACRPISRSATSVNFPSAMSRHRVKSSNWMDIFLPRFEPPVVHNSKYLRHYSTDSKTPALSGTQLKKEIDNLTDKFMEAREMVDDARESLGTVYFSDDMTEAEGVVQETLDLYAKLLEKLSDEQRQEVLRTIGLKMEELKAQQAALHAMLQDDH